jgi:hypothetical protein
MVIGMAVGGATLAAQRPAAPAAPAPGPTGAPATPAPAAPATPAAPRVFTGATGLLFNTVRADRVADFERVIGYVRKAFETSTNEGIRAQGRGWKVLKAAEPGPNGTVLYVFLIDPVVPGADYGLGRILADVITDATELQEVWKLYTGAMTTGGTLLNLNAVAATPAGPVGPGPAPREVETAPRPQGAAQDLAPR